MRIIIIGSGRVGREVAARLEERGENVVMVENDEAAIEKAREAGFTVHIGDGTTTDTLREAGAENAKIIVAATGDDETNLLVARLASMKFEVDRIICRVNDPENVEAFADLGVDPISSTHAAAQAIDDHIERPALARWTSTLGMEGDVQEVTLENDDFVGRPLEEVGPELPSRCLIVLVTHDDETFVPEASNVLKRGDQVTLVGDQEAVREAISLVQGSGRGAERG